MPAHGGLLVWAVDATALTVGNQRRQTSAEHRHGCVFGYVCHDGATIARLTSGSSWLRNQNQNSPVDNR